MYSRVIFIILALITIAHFIKRPESKVVTGEKQSPLSLIKWGAMAVILGLSIGSLSLSTFDQTSSSENLWASLLFLKTHILVLVVLTLLVYRKRRGL